MSCLNPDCEDFYKKSQAMARDEESIFQSRTLEDEFVDVSIASGQPVVLRHSFLSVQVLLGGSVEFRFDLVGSNMSSKI